MPKKNAITAQQAVDTALELLRGRREVKSLNLREIARALGCAHTNLYHYFSSYPQLLWAAYAAALGRMTQEIQRSLKKDFSPRLLFHDFFQALVGVYLNNPGWFRLVWLEYLGEECPESAVLSARAARRQMEDTVADLWRQSTGKTPDPALLHRTVHTVHCYLVGELSNFLSGRRLLEDAVEFQEYVVRQAARMTELFLQEE